MLPAIPFSGTKVVLFLPFPALYPASFYFLLPSMLKVTLYLSSDLKEGCRGLGSRAIQWVCFRSQVIWLLVLQ